MIRRTDTWWYDLRYRLAYWIHPDAYFRGDLLPKNEQARYIIDLVAIHGDTLPEAKRQEIVTLLTDHLGIKPILTRELPYLGD